MHARVHVHSCKQSPHRTSASSVSRSTYNLAVLAPCISLSFDDPWFRSSRRMELTAFVSQHLAELFSTRDQPPKRPAPQPHQIAPPPLSLNGGEPTFQSSRAWYQHRATSKPQTSGVLKSAQVCPSIIETHASLATSVYIDSNTWGSNTEASEIQTASIWFKHPKTPKASLSSSRSCNKSFWAACNSWSGIFNRLLRLFSTIACSLQPTEWWKKKVTIDRWAPVYHGKILDLIPGARNCLHFKSAKSEKGTAWHCN